MPYNLEKGPYLSMIEEKFNSSPQVLTFCLEYLRDTDNLVTGLLHEFHAPIPAGPFKTTKDLANHINEDWFGLVPNSGAPTGFDSAQAPFDPVGNATTGFWEYWYGDAQGIVREALERAIETALGLGHGDPIPAAPARHWRLNLFTICGLRWLEAWVNWRKIGGGPDEGIVTVFLLTPSHGQASSTSLFTNLRPGSAGFDPYAVNPAVAGGDQGLWVIGEQEVTDRSPATTQWSGLGEFACPGLGPVYVGDGGVVVVATPEAQGGVLPDGRPYGGDN